MTEMKEVFVLRSFSLSDDGLQLRELIEGTWDNVPAHLFAGLRASGWVSEHAPFPRREPDHDPTLSVAAEPEPEPVAKPSRRTRKEK
ncbi:hypothetical protein V5F41_03320 [Xanthobacter autotrophicus]|uniref:hypothetical protein n=1 Tax=Xanthobacter autotrophicus TaxID=280 RepID=UPI00372A616F